MLSLLLSACVSETTGGFDRAPPQEALENYLRLAQGYLEQGDLDLADDSFRRAIRLNSDNSQVRNNYAAFLFSNARYADAYEQLEIVVRDTTYPNRPQAFENMGLAALQLSRVDDAETAFTRALQLNGNRVRSTLELVEINLKRGNVNQAAEFYQRFLTMQQFFNLQQNARSLWIGIQLEEACGGNAQMREYASLLTERFPNSAEYAQYRQSLDE